MTLTKEGSIASFYTVNKAPIKHLRVYFSPKQAGSGDPSPDNIRPISGWDGVEVTTSGKNLLGGEAFKNALVNVMPVISINENIIVYSNNDAGLHDGEVVYDMFKPNTQYSFVVTASKNTNNYIHIKFQYDDGSIELLNGITPVNTKVTKVFVSKPNKTLAAIVRAADEYSNVTMYCDECGLFEGVLSLDDYEAYRGQLRTIDWSNVGSVYGGYVDLVTGELVNQWSVRTISEMGVTKTNGQGVWQHRFDMRAPWITGVGYESAFSNASDGHDVICSSFALGKAETNFTFLTYSGLIDVYDDTSNSVEEFKEKYGQYQVAYVVKPELYTTYQLSPTQLSTLIGRNNIWSNADRVEVEYDLAESNDELYRRRNILLRSAPHVETVSGSLAHFKTDLVAPLKECKVYFNPVQEGEGDPSPDNVRAITGWTNLGIMHKNGLPSEYQAVEYLQSTGTQFITGYFTPPTTGVITLKVVLEPKSMTNNYWYCGGRSNGNVSMQVGRYTGTWYKDRDSDIYKVISVTNGIEKIFCSKSYNTSLSYDYLLFGRAWNGSNPYSCKIFQCTLYFNDIPIYNYIPCYRKIDNVAGMYDTINNVFYTNEGTGTFITGQNIQTLPRPLLFESTHSFDWKSTFGTIYGGYIDLINGELVQAWKSITLNGEETWNSQAPHTFSNIDYDTMFLSDSLADMVYQQSTHGIISNMPTSTSASQKSNTGILCGQFGWSDRRFYIFNATQYLDGVSNVATLKAYLSQNPIQICYKLAKPIHYTLTPTQLKTLCGQNNIWSNANGDISIKYWTH